MVRSIETFSVKFYFLCIIYINFTTHHARTYVQALVRQPALSVGITLLGARRKPMRSSVREVVRCSRRDTVSDEEPCGAQLRRIRRAQSVAPAPVVEQPTVVENSAQRAFVPTGIAALSVCTTHDRCAKSGRKPFSAVFRNDFFECVRGPSPSRMQHGGTRAAVLKAGSLASGTCAAPLCLPEAVPAMSRRR